MQEQMRADLRRALAQAGLPFAEQEPLAAHTTFRIGGPAAFWCTPRDQQQLIQTLACCRQAGVRVYLLGNGSNTLFADEGFDGAVVDLRGLNPPVRTKEDGEQTLITASAGMTLGRLCGEAQQRALAGLEFACGIPGTVGGAVYMNAGAYGGELKDVLEQVTFLDEELNLRTLPASQLEMGYRTSVFEKNPAWCILSATLRLQQGDAGAILAQMQDYLDRRKAKQPLEWPSAGSTFKRPEGHFAAALIDQCGLKGFSVGDAQVSEKHAGFLVNKGKATAADMCRLMDLVRERVLRETGVELEPEVKFLGF